MNKITLDSYYKNQSRWIDYYPAGRKSIIGEERELSIADYSLSDRIYIVVEENGFKLRIGEYSWLVKEDCFPYFLYRRVVFYLQQNIPDI